MSDPPAQPYSHIIVGPPSFTYLRMNVPLYKGGRRNSLQELEKNAIATCKALSVKLSLPLHSLSQIQLAIDHYRRSKASPLGSHLKLRGIGKAYSEHSYTSYNTGVLGRGQGVIDIRDITLWCWAASISSGDLYALWCHFVGFKDEITGGVRVVRIGIGRGGC